VFTLQKAKSIHYMHQSISYSNSISLLRSAFCFAIHMQTETLGPLLKRKIKTAADQAASMLMPPPSSKCLYKHKATHQLGGDLLMNMVYFLNPQNMPWFFSVYCRFFLCLPKVYNNNNNNQAFQSQTSWGRLELKPIRSRSQKFRNTKFVCLQSSYSNVHLLQFP